MLPSSTALCSACALLIFSLIPGLHAEPRTFTSPDGRTLLAEIQSATPDMVTLKLVNGPILAVPINKFSESDQAFVAEWRKANPVTIKYDFASSYTKDKANSTKQTVNNVEITTETWLCNLKLANRSNQTLEGLKVNYEIYYSQANGPTMVTRKATGNATIPSLKHLEETAIKTTTVQLKTSKLEGGFYYADGSRSRNKDTIEGMVVKISHQGKQVYEWASSGLPKDRGAVANERK
ncbi:hypothetical protein EI77_00817 [Prosthecobacter fusiformis]|uniref:SLA1 homology domain-containing protein n=1 Tax=Prosthecobacter fusiformis TaxID=48464 RepID=A0A4R7STA9_9BACT|nr:hypothetical protein [Prosthecobacter fusiformis]TDU81507.1 hypothetical protein EI77_00817 [Prosthecobacter fusiformis]